MAEISEKDDWSIVYRDAAPQVLLVQPVDDHDMQGMGRLVEHVRSCGISFALALFPVQDWNTDLSPWEAPAVFGDRAFGCGAEKTLNRIEGALPRVIRELELAEDTPVALGGYSLAGLFSLWAAYRTKRFAAVCAASPSVWFPGWIDYAKSHGPGTRYIYLSLGDREEKTRNRTMAAVGECIRTQYELLGGDACTGAVLEWNPGNHFKDADIRTAKGFVWCMKRLIDSREMP